jgi:hypothetical protein
MKVVAKETGFYNGSRVRPGTIFEVPDGLKGKWFEPVETYKAKEEAAEAEPDTLSAVAKQSKKKIKAVDALVGGGTK